MTCVITSHWNPSSDDSQWPSMNPDNTTHYGLERQPSQGYASSGSESRKASSSSGKKRASRAGTRSVTTLSAAQLERKRANDREAQRAIRQRTKDHIENLERSVSDLRGSQEANEKLVAVTQQRNQELEEENAFLRSRLGDAGYPLPPESQRPSEAALISVHSASPITQSSASGSSIQRSPSIPAARTLSLQTQQPSNPHQASFHQPESFAPSVPNSGLSIGGAGPPANPANLAGWRPHEGSQSVQHAPIHPQDTAQHQSTMSYNQANPTERVDWAPPMQPYQYRSHEQQQPQRFEAPQPPLPPPIQQQPGYVQTPVQAFTTAPAHAPQGYHPPQLPPQAEFQNLAVSSPATYQTHQAQGYQQPQQPQVYQQTPQHQAYQQSQQQHSYPPNYQQPASYQMTPVQIPQAPAEYVSPHGQMHPPPMPPGNYPAPPPHGQHYAPHASSHSAVQYREDPSARSYALPHYPSG